MKPISNFIKFWLTYCLNKVRDFIVWCLDHDFFVILGLLPIFYMLYKRLFYIRPPKNLLFNPEHINLFQIGMYLLLCITFLVLLIYIMWKKWFKKQTELSEPVKFWLEKWSTYLNKRADYLLELSEHILPPYGNLLHKLCKLLHSYNNYFWVPVIILNCLPRIIISTMFLIDIFYFHEFAYFYKSLYLLLLPLIYRIFCYLIQKFYDTNYNSFVEILMFNNLSSKDGTIECTLEYLDPEDESILPIVDYLEQVYFPIANIPSYLETMEKFKVNYMFYTNIFVYSINIIGWGYLFYYNISHII